MNRRGFMGSILAFGVAPAVVRAQSIMRVRPLILPSSLTDVSGISARMNGAPSTRGGYLELIATGGYQLGRCELPLRDDGGPNLVAVATGVLSHIAVIDSHGRGWGRVDLGFNTPNILTGDFVHIHCLRLSAE